MSHEKATTALQPPSSTSETAILNRLFEARASSFSPEFARALLDITFSEADQARMEELAQKNQQGHLTANEREELRSYVKVGDLLSILHSKVRQALKQHQLSRRMRSNDKAQ